MNAADPNRLCSICDAPRGDLLWTHNGGAPAHVRCVLAGSAEALEAVGLRPPATMHGVPENEKRGRGRPPLNDKGGITRPVTVRLSDRNLETAGKVIAEGHAANVSDAIRWVMDRYEDESGKK